MTFHRALALACVLAAPAAAQPRQETLTLDRAIEIALQQQPSVRQKHRAGHHLRQTVGCATLPGAT